MKKVFALILACALLLPALAGFTVLATGQVATKPFAAITWSEVDEDKQNLAYTDDMYTIHIRTDTSEIPYFLKSGVGTDVDAIVAAIKKEMDSRPEGMRYLHVHGLTKAFSYQAENVIYLDKGVDHIKVLFADLMRRYYEIGGVLDGMVQDLEYIGLSSYYITQDLKKDTDLLSDIMANPLYATDVRPMLVERGFLFYNEDSYTPELFAISENAPSKYAQSRAIWDQVMNTRLAQYLNEAFCESVWKYFPDAIISDYQTSDTNAWNKQVDKNGAKAWLGGNAIKAGNVSNYNVYGVAPIVNMFYEKSGTTEYRTPVAYNDTFYADTPFNMHLWDTNRFKYMYDATDTKMVSVWITEYDYSTKRAGTIFNTPYYTENILHIGMLDPQPFLVYMYRPAFESDEAYYSRIGVIDEIMAELTRVLGAADRTPIPLPVNWNNSFVLSGMYAGGKNIWRITPDLSLGVTKETFKVEGEDPTFRIKGQTITFPGGKIIEDSTISVTGTCGYWVETATDVVPVITNEADRYSKYAAFQQDFEGYEVGEVFTFANAKPDLVWQITDKTKQGTVIVADKNDPNNKVLSVTGNIPIKITLLPKNVTAGDSYAKRQSWDLTFTLPETVAEGAELVMLDYAGKSQTVKDLGVKIADGKFYYTKVVEETVEGSTEENGEPKTKLVAEYQELKDVAMTPGGTYTVKRVMDFTNAEAYFCSYFLYDAEGVLLGSVENVPVSLFKTAVQTIGFSCKNFGEEAVCFDNLKLYAVGFAGDLSLFEAELGMELTDLEAAYSGKTAYRYSWMNASDKEETFQILAQVLDEEGKVVSETVIKELVTQPGYDGVETGIYDAGDQAVVFTAKLLVEEEPKNNMMLYVGIAAGAVLLIAVGVAVAVVLSKKKKK